MQMVSVLMTVAVCLGVMSPWVEGTLSWFITAPDLPSLTLRDTCGARVFVAENGVAENGTTVVPIEEREGTEDGQGILADTPWPWVVRIGEGAVGIMLSQQHVVTLAHCLQNYTSWFRGFQSFSVEVGGGSIEVPRVQVQGMEGGSFPLALLTLESNLGWIPGPVCVGAMQEGLLAAVVGWGEDGILREEPLPLRRRGQCKSFFLKKYDDEVMICGGAGTMDCGAPLLQADDGRWMVVGLGVGDLTPVARYVRLEQSREWLETA